MPDRTLPAPPSGLHARVALRIVRAARRFQADLRVGYAGRWASARRLAELLALGAPAGAELTLRADGPDAEETLDAMVSEVRDQGPGAGGREARGEGVEASSEEAGRRVYRGVGASAGRARGVAVVRAEFGDQGPGARGQLLTPTPQPPIPDSQSPTPELADWLEACAELWADPAWREALAQGRIGDSALERELAQWLADNALTPPTDAQGAPHILIAREILPADLFGRPGLVGAASVRGGTGSHAAIIARALGLPLVVGLPPAALDEIAPGATVALDGAAGTLAVS